MIASTPPSGLKALTDLLAPITAVEFFEEYWQRKVLLVKRADPDFYAELLSVADIDRLLSSVSLPVNQVNLGQNAVGISTAQYSDGVYVRTSDVLRLHRAGNTMILRSMHLWLPKLRALCEDMEEAFLSDAQANLYLTPAHTHSSYPHWDAHDILVIQIAGSKRWIFHENALELPLRTFEFDQDRHPIGPETGEIFLEAGDIAYIPRGLAHNPMATDYSVHVALGIKVNTWADVMANICSQLFLGDKAFREALPINIGRGGFDRSSCATRFRDLAERFTKIRMQAALDALEEVHLARRNPRTEGTLTSIAKQQELGLDTVISLPSGARAEVRVSGEHCEALINGIRLRFGNQLAEPFEFLSRARTLRVKDIPAQTDEQRLALVEKLVDEGCVVVTA